MPDYDVIVVGGGIAGVCSAVAAKRMGVSVLLLEKDMALGGVLTNALVNPMMTFHSPLRQIAGAIAQEIVDRLVKIKGSYGHIKDPIGFVKTITPFEPEKLKTVLINMLHQENVDYLFGCLVSDVKTRNGTVTQIEVATMQKKINLNGKIYIDSTGDGNFCIKAGAPYVEGNNDRKRCQPMTLIMKLSRVNKKEIISYIQTNPEQFTLANSPDFSYLAVSGFFDHMKKLEKYNVRFKRDRLLFFEVPFREDEVFMNTTRYPGYAADPMELTRAQSCASLDIWNFLEFLNNEIPGFESAKLEQVGCTIGIRETSHIIGDYQLTIKDLLETRDFQDKIAIGAYPVDLHSPNSSGLKTIKIPYPGEYQIPLRSLFPQGLNNVLLSGRNISADHLAFSAIRTSPLAASIGLAAGICAAIAVRENCNIRDVRYQELQGEIKRMGGIL